MPGFSLIAAIIGFVILLLMGMHWPYALLFSLMIGFSDRSGNNFRGDIWGGTVVADSRWNRQRAFMNTDIANTYCKLHLGTERSGIFRQRVITVTEIPQGTTPVGRKLTALLPPAGDDFWVLLYENFDKNSTFESVKDHCKILGLNYKQTTFRTNRRAPLPQKKEVKPVPVEDKVDINNCSESELAALPGVNKIIAKKVIKRREELGEFHSVEEFLDFVKLSPTIADNLKPRIVINKMKQEFKIEKTQERNIDL